MARDLTKVVAKIVDIRTAAEGTALDTIAKPMVYSGSWTQPGTPTGSITLEIGEERAQFKPHDELGPTKETPILKSIKVTMTFGESAIDQFVFALSSATSSAGVLSDGGTTNPTYFGWNFETENGLWHLKRASGDGNAPVEIPDDNYTMYQLIINGFHRTAETAGQRLWQFHDFAGLGV